MVIHDRIKITLESIYHMRLVEAIDLLADTYNSIDIRTVSSFYNNSWQSIITVIRFRTESVSELKNIHNKILDKIGIIWDDDFRISLDVFSISAWQEIRENWHKRFLILRSDFSVNIPTTGIFDSNQEVPFQNHNDYVNENWNSYFAVSNVSFNGLQSILNRQNKKANKQGFQNIIEHIHAILEITPGIIQDSGLAIITAPIFVKITSAIFEDKNINIVFTGHKIDMALMIAFSDLHPNGTPKKIVQREIAHYKANNEETDGISFSVSKTLETIPLDHHLKISAYKDTLLIAQYENFVNGCFPKNAKIINPLSEVFQKFVSCEELEKLLFNFEGRESQDKSMNFERGVSWLLSLMGFNVIWLGKKYESIGENPNKVAMDILCSDGCDKIMLVNVTIGIPDSSAITRELNYREILSKPISDEKIEILSVVFSGAQIKGLDKIAKENGVVLIGRDEIISILKFLKEGNIHAAKTLLSIDPHIQF